MCPSICVRSMGSENFQILLPFYQGGAADVKRPGLLVDAGDGRKGQTRDKSKGRVCAGKAGADGYSYPGDGTPPSQMPVPLSSVTSTQGPLPTLHPHAFLTLLQWR